MCMYLVQPRNNRQLCISTLRNICRHQNWRQNCTYSCHTCCPNTPLGTTAWVEKWTSACVWWLKFGASNEETVKNVFVCSTTVANTVCDGTQNHQLSPCRCALFRVVSNPNLTWIFFLKRAVFKKIKKNYFNTTDYILPMPKKWVKHVPVAVHMSDKNSHKHCLVGAHK